jgi:hypothetical protein
VRPVTEDERGMRELLLGEVLSFTADGVEVVITSILLTGVDVLDGGRDVVLPAFEEAIGQGGVGGEHGVEGLIDRGMDGIDLSFVFSEGLVEGLEMIGVNDGSGVEGIGGGHGDKGRAGQAGHEWLRRGSKRRWCGVEEGYTAMSRESAIGTVNRFVMVSVAYTSSEE